MPTTMFSPLPYPTLFRSQVFSRQWPVGNEARAFRPVRDLPGLADRDIRGKIFLIEPFQIAPAPDALFKGGMEDRKSTRLNSSHRTISYAVFCLKKKKKK